MPLTRKDYDEIHPRIRAYALSLCRDRQMAHDLVNDTFLKAAEQLDVGLEITDLTAWCVTVMRNRYLDLLKKKKEAQLDPTVPEDSNFKDESVGADIFSSILFSECMKQLNPQHAEVMILSIIRGKTTKIIAEVLNKPQNTILTWLTKAKTQFHDCIEGQT